MGTSNANSGQGGRTPLVPSWLPSDETPPPVPQPPPEMPADTQAPDDALPAAPAPPALPSIPPIAPADRFTAARNNFSRFASSGGGDRASLGCAVSSYVSTSSGGSRSAAQRMGSSRISGARLLGFLSDAIANGSRQALRTLNLENLAGQRIEQVFIGMMDYVCPEGGTVDEGIAREAFIETIADLAENGVTDLDTLTADQMQTIFELYATHTIETRLCNDIGAKLITMPTDVAQAVSIQRQLFDFIRRSVADALTNARATLTALTPERFGGLVTRVYEQAFGILQSLGDAEAETS
jgi:hypothetical protein